MMLKLITLISALFLLINASHALKMLEEKHDNKTIIKQANPSTAAETPLSLAQIVTKLKQSAKTGEARAQFSLATMYQRGVGVKRNPALAFYWYQQVAEQGYAGAQYRLATLYLTGVGVKKNSVQAQHWLELAAHQDFLPAQKKLTQLQQRNANIPLKKKPLSKKIIAKKPLIKEIIPKKPLIKEVITIKKLDADVDLIVMDTDEKLIVMTPSREKIAASLAHHTKIMTNAQNLIRELIADATNGKPAAQHKLSGVYQSGVWVEKDEKKAFLLMKAAAKQNLAIAQNALSKMYIDGIGVDIDYQKAYYWVNKSFQQGNSESKQILQYLLSKIQ